jgi:hypothetical protein
LDQVDVRPYLDEGALLGLDALQVVDGTQFVGALVEGDGVLVVDDLEGVVEDGDLDGTVLPSFRNEAVHWELDVLGFGFVVQGEERLEGLLVAEVKLDVEHVLVGVERVEGFQDLDPVDVGVQLAKGACQVVETPGLTGLLVAHVLIEVSVVSSFAGLVDESDLTDVFVVRSLVVVGKLEQGASHGLLVDVLELLQHVHQLVVVVACHVTQVEEDVGRVCVEDGSG